MATVLISTAISVGLGAVQSALMDDIVTNQEGARIESSQITSASEGSVINRVYNTTRIGGTVIWETTFREEIVTTTTSQGGKGGPSQETNSTTYTYYKSFAVGICEGEEGLLLRKIYFDGIEADLTNVTYRFYDGSRTQMPDPKIEATEGEGTVPAYRGLAYIVFDEMDLTNYSNRPPQVTAEVTRLVNADNPSSLDKTLKAVNIIPGSGEQLLSTDVVTNNDGSGGSVPVNMHASTLDTDLVVSLDTLASELPLVNSASLVVSWFGSSTDATTCIVEPKVENTTNRMSPNAWRVSDRVRSTAQVVSSDAFNNPNYGGTPSDISVRQALQEMKGRGMRVMFYPFILMDSTGFPWRGRIEGDSTNFMGTVTPAHYGVWNGSSLPYFGPVEWSQRRMILHYAALVADIMVAGDAFLVGSEMVGLSVTDPDWGTRVADLIADVRSILPAGTLVSYAADWSEYKEGSLLPVWQTADFVGIDNYLPITDWRDGDETYDVEHFKAGIEGGEYYDYYYLNDEDRENKVQTPIDHPQFRQKDIRYWSTVNHPTKPVWFTEFGCPAIDKGANQPNVFVDPKSVESNAPHHSNGEQNVFVQQLYLQAMLEYWNDDGFINTENMFVWTWDARPYPAYPARTDIWSDGENWRLGHWITGRVGTMTLARLVRILMIEAGIDESEFDVTSLERSGVLVHGMSTVGVTTPREVLENLMRTYMFDVFEDGEGFVFVMRRSSETITVDPDDLILSDSGSSYTKPRQQDTDLPDRTQVTFLDSSRDYSTASVDGHTVTGYSRRVESFTSNCVLFNDYGRALADVLTQEKWTEKNSIQFSLPMNYLAIRPGDSFPIELNGVTRRYRIRSIDTGDQLDVEAVGYSNVIYELNSFPLSTPTSPIQNFYGSSLVIFADIPLYDPNSANLWSPRIIGTQRPWPGAVNILESDGSGGYDPNTVVTLPAAIGELVNDLGKGVVGRWDDLNELVVRLYDTSQNLSSQSDLSVLNGKNALAIMTPSGEWEILQFANAALNGDGTYTLTRLLRGQLGTDVFMGEPSIAGTRFFVYDPGNFSNFASITSRLGAEIDVRYGPANMDYNDNRYINQVVTPRGVALRPYSPVHLRQVKQPNGDILLSWVRRTRFDGDSWEGADAPLNEESESYEVDISGGMTLHVAASQSVLYTVADQTTDFGGTQAVVGWTVHQISAIYGRGAPATA